MAHPSVVWGDEGEVLPGHRVEVTENTIDDTEGGFQVRVFLVVIGSRNLMSARDRLEYCPIGPAANALALNGEVEESPGAGAGLVPKLGGDHWVSS